MSSHDAFLQFYPDNMNILANVGFPLAIMTLAFSCQATLAQYWVSIGNIGVGFISALKNGIILYSILAIEQYRANYWDYVGPILA